MGIVEGVLNTLFGGGRNVLKETVEVFRENADKGADRSYDVQMGALEQHGREFVVPRNGNFDQIMDGVNRLPRPALALGTLGLFVSAMVSPLWFAERMQGIALVPEPLWWLLGVIVSFYFGARHQVKSQEFQREIVGSVTHVPQVMQNITKLRKLRAQDKGAAETGGDVDLALASIVPESNAALEDWRHAA
ncbi:MAG: holin family protein [Aliishimia sp.]